MAHFVKLRSGIVTPKHVEAIGLALWLFVYILDNCDWEDGVMRGYTDKEAARSLGMPLRTIRSHRRRLEDAEYIAAERGFQCQNITVSNWTDPRHSNTRMSVHSDTHSDIHSDMQMSVHSDIHRIHGDVTPTLYPESDSITDNRIQNSTVAALQKIGFNKKDIPKYSQKGAMLVRAVVNKALKTGKNAGWVRLALDDGYKIEAEYWPEEWKRKRYKEGKYADFFED